MLLIFAIIVFLALTALTSRQLTFTRQWVNPMTVFNIPHALLLICYLLSLDAGIITFQLGDTALLLLAAAYFSFNAGVFLVALIAMVMLKTRRVSPSTLDAIPIDRVFLASRFLFAILAACVAYKYFVLIRQYGDFYNQIVQVRTDYYTGQLDFSAAHGLAYISAHFLAINLGIIIGCGFRVKKHFLLLSLLLALGNDISIGGGIYTFSCLMLFLIAWAATRDRLFRVRFSLGFMRKGALLMAALATIIFSLLFFRSEGYIGGQTSFYDVVTGYAGGDIATFGYFVENPYPSSPAGRSTFGGLYSTADDVLSIFGDRFLSILKEQDYVADIGFNNPLADNIGFNTSIYMSHSFADFGAVGVVAISLLLGMTTMWSMVLYRQKFQIVRLQYFVLMLFVCFISIRHVLTEGKFFWLLLIAFPVINRLAKSRRKIGSKRDILDRSQTELIT